METLSPPQPETIARLALEAREYALSRGLLKYSPEGQVTHLGFSLTPWRAPRRFVERTRALTRAFNRLYATVTQDHDFLRRELEGAARTDPFVASLLGCLQDAPPDRPQLFMTRNDFLPLASPTGLEPRQVEINLISASLGPASQKVSDLHRFLYREDPLGERILPTRAGDEQVQALARAWELFGDRRARVLFLLPPNERAVFDQLYLVNALVVEHGIPVMRCTMEELGREGELRGGHLWFRGRKVAIGYFRGGYAPPHYEGPASWRSRQLLEASAALSVPTVAAQLANMKKIQQRLNSPEVLARYAPAEEARAMASTFVTMANPLETISWRGMEGPARDLALASPDDWLLKPQREGGGNNLHGAEMCERLRSITPEEDEAFVLMETIHAEPFHSVRLAEGQVLEGECVTELGVYGAWLMESPDHLDRPLLDQDQGVLLRTKDRQSREGLVLGGFAALDALAVDA